MHHTSFENRTAVHSLLWSWTTNHLSIVSFRLASSRFSYSVALYCVLYNVECCGRLFSTHSYSMHSHSVHLFTMCTWCVPVCKWVGEIDFIRMEFFFLLSCVCIRCFVVGISFIQMPKPDQSDWGNSLKENKNQVIETKIRNSTLIIFLISTANICFCTTCQHLKIRLICFHRCSSHEIRGNWQFQQHLKLFKMHEYCNFATMLSHS